MLARPDFLSLAVVSVGFFALECPNYITRRAFRMLVVMALFTFIYDFVFLLFVRDVQAEDMEFQGMQVNVRRFAYLFVWLSVLFRPIIVVLLWKDSRDFRRIIRGKSGTASGSNTSGADNQDLELARVMAQYNGGNF